MAPRTGHNGHKTCLQSGPHPAVKEGAHGQQVQDEGHKITLTQKLMLSAELWAMEASCDFEQLYSLPILQTLGMPLSLVSMTGFISGLSAVVLLSATGWITDRGPNPVRRKTAALLCTAGVLISGMACIIVANMLHITSLLDNDNDKDFNSNNSFVSNMAFPAHQTAKINGSINILDRSDIKDGIGNSIKTNITEGLTIMTNYSADTFHDLKRTDTQETSEIPFKAGLGMLGIVLLDVGFDAMNSFGKSFMLTCSPRSEHTSLLVVGLIMGSAGGMSTAVLGVVDFASLLDLSYIEGASLSIQTSVQGLVVIVFVTLGVLITLLTGRRQLQRNVENDDNLATIKDMQTTADANRSPHCQDQTAGGSVLDIFQDSIRSFSEAAGLLTQPVSVMPEMNQPDTSENTPLLVQDSADEDYNSVSRSIPKNSISASYGTNESTATATVFRKPLEDVSKGEFSRSSLVGTRTFQPCSARNFKAKITLICISCFFAIGTTLMFTSTISDFVGKAIYNGNPDASPGSQNLARYQAGVRMSSWGLFVYFVSYLLVSFVHGRLLAFMGPCAMFVLAHLLLVGSMVMLALTSRLEVFFLLAVLASLQRACVYSLPFATANDAIQSRIKERGEDKSNVGLAMSLVAVSFSTAYLTLYTLIGPLEQLSGMVSIPLWLGAGYGCLSSAAFLCIGKT